MKATKRKVLSTFKFPFVRFCKFQKDLKGLKRSKRLSQGASLFPDAPVIAMGYVFLGGIDKLSAHLFDTLQMRMSLVGIPVQSVG